MTLNKQQLSTLLGETGTNEHCNGDTSGQASKKAKRKRTQDHGDRENQASKCLKLVEAGFEFFTDHETPYCRFCDDDGIEKTYPVRSTYFGNVLTLRYLEQYKRPLSAASLNDARNTLTALASRCQKPVYKRTARYNGHVYIDLCNSQWQAVECTPTGWSIIENSPVAFVRSKDDCPLPVPHKGGALQLLDNYIHTSSNGDMLLLYGFLIGTLVQLSAYPVLVLSSQQGTGKSFATTVIKSLIDPSRIMKKMMPKSVDDAVISASHSWLYTLDNVSYVSNDLSDAFCMILTGAGIGKRTLYQDAEESTIQVLRPMLLNGIGNFITRGDLADRAITLELASIEPQERKPQETLYEMLERDKGKIFGAICDAVCNGLRNEHIKFAHLPRLADFGQFVARCLEQGNGEGEAFLHLLSVNQMQLFIDQAEEDSTVAFVEELLTLHGGAWEGTTRTLYTSLEELHASREEGRRLPPGFPKGVSELGKHLNRLQPQLKAIGVIARTKRINGNSHWLIHRKKAEE